jgi:UDP-N-acetylmuramyl pentapeptide phosphotransferase/UDP-N-acetylglucosamine-1-phosphate transferase
VISTVIATFVAFFVSALITRRICDPASRLHILDHPNERSLHARPTPRTGGVAILTGIVAATPVWATVTDVPDSMLWLSAGVMLVAVLSFMDDRRGLLVRWRFMGHVTAATLVIVGGLHIPVLSLPGVEWVWPGWLSVAFSFLFLVWMINLYNFMDGMDGFAGGMAVIGFSTYALLGALAGNVPFAALNAVAASASGGFLLFNFPPARIFMGDTGSSILGLLAGASSLWAARDNLFPFWAGLLVFSPFIVDASVTLLRRLLRRERVWEAHKMHYYQRLVQLGWGHKRTVLWEYALMLVCGLGVLWTVRQPVFWQWLVIGVSAACYLSLATFVHVLDRDRQSHD